MAGKFTFRLETVLKLRRRVFEDKQRVVAERLRAIADERAMIEAVRAEWDDQRRQSRVAQVADRLDVASVRGHRTHMVFLNRCVAESESRIRAHEAQLTHERATMVEAQVAVKAIEKLKERRLARHVDEANRRETAEHAEHAVRMFSRQETNAL